MFSIQCWFIILGREILFTLNKRNVYAHVKIPFQCPELVIPWRWQASWLSILLKLKPASVCSFTSTRCSAMIFPFWWVVSPITLTNRSAGVASDDPRKCVPLDTRVQVLWQLKVRSVNETVVGLLGRASIFYERPRDHHCSMKGLTSNPAVWGLSWLCAIQREQENDSHCTKLHRNKQRHPTMLIHLFH